MALLATLRGIAVSGETIALPSKPGLWTGLIDSEFAVNEISGDSVREKIKAATNSEGKLVHPEVNFFGDNRVVVISTDWDLSQHEWSIIKKKATDEDVILVADSIGDFGSLTKANEQYCALPFNPLKHGYVDVMLANTEDIGGPLNSTAIISDPKRYRNLRPAHEKTLCGNIDSMVFPSTIGGGDLVAMAEAAIALAAFKYQKYKDKTEPSKLL
jgi:hypothetical protein